MSGQSVLLMFLRFITRMDGLIGLGYETVYFCPIEMCYRPAGNSTRVFSSIGHLLSFLLETMSLFMKDREAFSDLI